MYFSINYKLSSVIICYIFVFFDKYDIICNKLYFIYVDTIYDTWSSRYSVYSMNNTQYLNYWDSMMRAKRREHIVKK